VTRHRFIKFAEVANRLVASNLLEQRPALLQLFFVSHDLYKEIAPVYIESVQ
jgi:hypothetical protein